MKGAVVLAAGRSRRMGTQKLLLPFGSSSVIGHIVDELLASELDRICVVVAGGDHRVREALADRPVELATNPSPEDGMLSSVRCGWRALPAACDPVLIALGDQPALTAAVVDRLLAAFAGGGRGIVVPVHESRRGHPIVLSSRHKSEVLERFEDVGLRGLLRAHADDVLELPIDDDAVLRDMDEPADYERERRLWDGGAPRA